MKWVIANALRTVMNRSARKKYPEIDNYYKNPGIENAGNKHVPRRRGRCFSEMERHFAATR